jgi:superfamily II DNA or RNA helicase
LKQWKEVVCVLFQLPCLIVEGGIGVDQIVAFLEKNPKCIVITTYSSAHKVYDATQSFVFDMKINDEVHHLTSTGMKSEKAYVKMLDIPSVKQLSLTATLKHLEGIDTISNDSVSHFGDIMDKKCLAWAIQEKVICDYVIQTIVTNENMEQFGFHMDENDQRLFLSAYAALRSIHDGHSHHLLIYANNKDNSLKLIKFIKLLLDYFEMDVYASHYHSDMASKEQKDILQLFETSSVGIIACVYCLGEGWDFPLLDGVVFAENMTSNIRIVQSALRASRKNKKEATKVAKIILPILNRDWLDNENPDLKKVREVIYQMGLEDETIEQKIKVYRIDMVKPSPIETSTDYFGEYDAELTRNLRLKTIERASGITYEKARTLLTEKRIQSKEAYYDLCEKDIRLPKEPDLAFKGSFTNWVDYLSIERRYYELDECKQHIRTYLNHPTVKPYSLDLSKMCNALVSLEPRFPPAGLWTDYYKVNDLRDIISIPTKKGKGCL